MANEAGATRLLEGQVALVTGGSKGIGAAIANQLADAGCRVIVTFSRDEGAAGALVANLPGRGHRYARTPVEDSAALDELLATIAAREGRLDILVNNAGETKPIPHRDLQALDDAFFDLMLTVNLRGMFATVRAAVDLLRSSGNGLIVNLSSIAAARGFGSNIAYAAAKAGVNCMTLSLARALAPEIRVVAIAPGATDTPMFTMWTEAQRESGVAANPLKRIGQPHEIAAIVLALRTTMTFVNGTVITSDGGQVL